MSPTNRADTESWICGLSRTFRAGSTSMLGTIELYNALNTSPLLASNATYGARWLEPVEILSGRLLQFGAQFPF